MRIRILIFFHRYLDQFNTFQTRHILTLVDNVQNGFEHNSFNFEDRTFPKIDAESLSSSLSGFIKRLDTFIDYLLIKSGAKWPKMTFLLSAIFVLLYLGNG